MRRELRDGFLHSNDGSVCLVQCCWFASITMTVVCRRCLFFWNIILARFVSHFGLDNWRAVFRQPPDAGRFLGCLYKPPIASGRRGLSEML